MTERWGMGERFVVALWSNRYTIDANNMSVLFSPPSVVWLIATYWYVQVWKPTLGQ